jgi:cytochrome P450
MQDPTPYFARLREQDPVHLLPILDAWLVTRHDDVLELFSDTRVTTDPSVYEAYETPTGPDAERWLMRIPFRSSASGGESLGRRLVSAALRPRAVSRLEERCREVVERFAAPLRGSRGVVDLKKEFIDPISATAIGRILGVLAKAEDERRFGQLARRATRSIRPIMSPKARRKCETATIEMCEYVLELVEERRRAPEDDMLSDLLRASEGDPSVTTDDVVKVVAGLVAAGTGTTAVACAWALRSLFLHPDQLCLLREDRSLLENAIGELLRYDSGVIVMPRYAREDLQVRGCSISEGQLVVLSILGANRDPSVFQDPDRLDLRRDTRRAVSFGHGHHYCVGVNIARLEMRLMLDALLEILPPDARLLEDQIHWSARGMMSQLGSLPVDFG